MSKPFPFDELRDKMTPERQKKNKSDAAIDIAWEDYKTRVYPQQPVTDSQKELINETRSAFAAGWGAHREHVRSSRERLEDDD